ncbi:glutamate synthase large subunit [uncultured Helicobacter sp.]|uniref:glutamate synthase large subunit n=1 Tax=uncultured Helicobacter sp. TaxID=175537 RepID=UPI0027DB2A03|nr:glutamate synthase large subunit [uncultured Helicobacter sp.]
MNQIQTNNHTQSHTINTNPHQNTQNTYHDSINSHTTISATTSQRAESNPLELKQIGLYESSFEHDACGIGAVANIKGERSYQVISSALNILMQLEHRGGAGAEDNTGDGAGILIQIPHEFFKTQDLGFELGEEGDYAIAQVFLSPNAESKQKGKEIFLQVLQEQGLEFLGLRAVPINPSDIGPTARNAMPFFLQIFVRRPQALARGLDFERKLYVARRIIEKRAADVPKFYICSFSSRTIVYKGMLLSTQLSDFYLDFKDVNLKSAIALVHSRFSTNTFPSWERAHPNRYMVHNGEINTIKGNVDGITAREGLCESEYFEDLSQVFPIIAKPSSDSAMFDNTLEFLSLNGRSLEEAFMMMIPEPWSKNHNMEPKRRAFYEYHSTLMEPWDGPASIIFTDGVIMGASLDRNGFRPSRYYLTKDNLLILASETGALKIDESNILAKKRLEPGKILLVDTARGRLVSDSELKEQYANARPYTKWLQNLIKLEKLDSKGYKERFLESSEVLRLQKAFGWSYDELSSSVLTMAQNGKESLAAMGIDTPLAVLDDKPQNLFSYFKQLFAQVTNPPLDAIREEIVTSQRIYLGREGNLLKPSEQNCKRVKLSQPIISNEELYKIENLKGFKVARLSLTYKYKEQSLESALEALFTQALEKIESGSSILILSDRGIDEHTCAIPSLLAVSGLHNFLVRRNFRTHASLVIESAEPREIHHLACLLGYGATAINPYLVYESLNVLIAKNDLKLTYAQAVQNYIHAAMGGIVKIASKMGISTMQSYNGAQIFEALGIESGVIEKYFTSTPSKIEGITLEDIQSDYLRVHKAAFASNTNALESKGLHAWRAEGEEHLLDPMVIFKLQESCRRGDYELFKEYTSLVDSKLVSLRDCLEFDFSEAISINEVESVDSIVKRFKSGAMSYGSISQEVHECLAIAMNRLHAKSNSGEGGENAERYKLAPNGDNKSSAIKQVASGRFGVDIEYLVNAKELQIKVAQGAKPGEGGQLPGFKVYPWVAKARHSTPGVTLISPPPHHDIYSIEDLAQLIYDLKNANTAASISVKLVSEAGIGTVAAGVAKAGANIILVSGYDGGTGASPRTSIANAGLPWELGLAETHQTLILNRLRDRVRLETDGKLLSGRDLAVATLLGAEEFGFATAPLMVLGCTMMRVCHLNTCPFGIATQDETLRDRFKGKPEYVMNFMRFIAQELREYMAKLGFRSVDEMVGRVDKLRQKRLPGKAGKINLDRMIKDLSTYNKSAVHCTGFKGANLDRTIDSKILLPLCKNAIKKGRNIKLSLEVSNLSRTFATILSSEVTKIYGAQGLREDSIQITAIGSAGNSFGAFLNHGITLEIIGDSNDYLGKGLSGGKIIAKTSPYFSASAEENIIVGNACLYGASAGEVYLDGIAGERFCVRNSGVSAVVLGMGVHGCEYMTGGRVLVLGDVGENFAAGMSGGYVYILGQHNIPRVNSELVDIRALDESDEREIKQWLERHITYTESNKAKQVLKYFDKNDFFKVLPRDYERALKALEACKNKENPELAAFLEIAKG